MPFLKIAATRANFHFDGNLEFFRLSQKIVLRPSIAEFPATARSLAWIPSGPAAFLGLSLFRSWASLSLQDERSLIVGVTLVEAAQIHGFSFMLMGMVFVREIFANVHEKIVDKLGLFCIAGDKFR